MSTKLSPLGIALILIFAISLLALFSQILYVLWRRRIFRRNIPITSSSSPTTSFGSSFSSSSKELLLFFCLRTETGLSRVGPNSGLGLNSDVASPESPEMELIDLLKLQGMYGPSRILFTIKEEEREDLESEKSIIKSMSLQDCVKIEEGSVKNSPELTSPVPVTEKCEELPEMTVTVDDTTPFSTPCASPLYLTPAASPAREIR